MMFNHNMMHIPCAIPLSCAKYSMSCVQEREVRKLGI